MQRTAWRLVVEGRSVGEGDEGHCQERNDVVWARHNWDASKLEGAFSEERAANVNCALGYSAPCCGQEESWPVVLRRMQPSDRQYGASVLIKTIKAIIKRI